MLKTFRFLLKFALWAVIGWGIYRVILFLTGKAVLPDEIVRVTFLSAFVLVYPLLKRYPPRPGYLAIIWFSTSLLLCWLKNEQYVRLVSTGFDLGIRANILYNILEHGKVWDSLNQVHGFSGHFWPIAYLLSLLLRLWHDPRILLFVQAVFLSSSIFPLFLIMKSNRVPVNNTWLFLILFLFNPYFHNINSFDFHPESLGTAFMLWFLYLIEQKKLSISILLMILTFTLKEDTTIAFGSLAVYGVLFDKEFRKYWVFVGGLSFIYFVLSLMVISHYGSLGRMISSNYAFDPLPFKRLEYSLKFFASTGFLSLLSPSRTLMFVLPFLEHIISSWKPHFQLSGQYTAMLLPLTTYVGIKNSRHVSDKLANVLILAGIIYSISQLSVRRYLPERVQLPSERYKRIELMLSTLPDRVPIAGGNHITPHIALRDSTYQLPLVLDAELILVDTTWHDYYPLDEDKYRELVDSLLTNGFEDIPNNLGLMVMRRK